MRFTLAATALLAVLVGLTNSLTVRDPTNHNNSIYAHSPRIYIGEFTCAFNLTIKHAKNRGCNKQDFSPVNAAKEVWIVQDGFCPTQEIIKAARAANVERVVIVWTANGKAGYNAKIGAIGIKFSDIQVFEVTKDDGKLLKQGFVIDFLHNDENDWDEFWNSPELVIWQISLGLLFLLILGIALVKLRLLNSKWDDARKFKIPSFSLILTSISCIICLLYILVDPMQSRGIYIRQVYLILLTLYLPCTITTSLFMTWSLLQTFTATSITTIGRKLEQTLKVFKILSVLATLFDLLLSALRGFIYDPELSYIAALPTIFYCVAAAFMIALYGYLVFKVVHKHNGAPIGIFKHIRTFQEKNLWIFCLCYLAWMVSMVSGTIYFDSSANRTPTNVALIYFFAYFCVGMINLFHVLIIKLPDAIPPLTPLNTLELRFNAPSQTSTMSDSEAEVPANTATNSIL